MSSPRIGPRCQRVASPKEISRDDALLDFTEDTLLTASRYYFQSFACPETHGWLQALSITQVHFGDTMGPAIAVKLLTAMQAMRCSRKSMFQFNAPACPCCAEILTEHERRFMTAIQAMRIGDLNTVRLEIMLLCEGFESEHVVDAFRDLNSVLPPRKIRSVGTCGVANLAQAIS